MSEQGDIFDTEGVREAVASYSVAPTQALQDSVPAGYRRTGVGVIPADWNLPPLGDLFSFSNGINANKGAYGHGTPFINVLEPITYSHIRAKDIPGKVDVSARAANIYSVKYGDIVFNRTSEVQEEVGLAAAYVDKAPVVFGGFVIRARPNGKRIDPIYAGYALRSPGVRAQIIAKGQGAIRSNVGQESLRGVLVPIPQICEQHAIANALSDADALIESLDRLIAKKRAIKQGTMQQLLTGQKRLPGFDGEWKTKRLGEIGRFRGGNGFPTIFQGHTSGQYPYFKVSDMNNERNEILMEAASNYISESTRSQLGAIAFPSKSIVFAKVGAAVFLERKKILSKPSCLDNNMGAFTLGDADADFKFIYYFLLSISLGSFVSTTALPSLNSKVLAGIECLLPSLQEQLAIANILSDMDAEIEALEHRRDKARQLKQGMMQQLLTGRVRLIDPEAQP